MTIPYSEQDFGGQGANPLSGMAEVIGRGRARLNEPRYGRMPSLLISLLAHALIIYAIMHVPMQIIRPMAMKALTISLSVAQPEAQKPVPEKPKLEKVKPATIIAPLPDVTPPPITTMMAAAPPATNAAKSEAKPAEPETTEPVFNADYLNNTLPPYPNMSKRLRETGTVLLRVRVSAEGTPLEVILFKSCGYSRLDDAALTAVRKWKFEPARRAGAAVEAWVRVPVEFSLKHAH